MGHTIATKPGADNPDSEHWPFDAQRGIICTSTPWCAKRGAVRVPEPLTISDHLWYNHGEGGKVRR